MLIYGNTPKDIKKMVFRNKTKVLLFAGAVVLAVALGTSGADADEVVILPDNGHEGIPGQELGRGQGQVDQLQNKILIQLGYGYARAIDFNSDCPTIKITKCS